MQAAAVLLQKNRVTQLGLPPPALPLKSYTNGYGVALCKTDSLIHQQPHKNQNYTHVFKCNDCMWFLLIT